MKGRSLTNADRVLHFDLATYVGCIACSKDGRFNDYVSIHHIDGRTKKGAHQNVLPLCAGHHQQGTGAPGLIAVHPYKAQFEEMYGKQEDLLAECLLIIEREKRP